jgi:hypothetical protein
MSRISPNVAISVRILCWDLDSYSHSARKHNIVTRSIHKWLTETQIIDFPRWKALHLELSGDAQGESIIGVFDMLCHRDDELDYLVIRVTREVGTAAPPDATLAKLRFRPKDFRLDGIMFPIEMLARPLNQVTTLHYEGGVSEPSTMVPPQNSSPITLQRLSGVIFHNVNTHNLFRSVIAPSLTSLHLNNALHRGHGGVEVSPGLISRFAPGLQHLQISDMHPTLSHWMVPQFSLANLLTLNIELYHSHEYDDQSLIRILTNMDMSSTFPKLEGLILQYVPTPPQEFEWLLQSLPASTATVTLVECPESEAIPIDFIVATHNINFSIQLSSDDDLDGDWTSNNSEVQWELEQEGESDLSDCDMWSDGLLSVSTFASDLGEFRVRISKHEATSFRIASRGHEAEIEEAWDKDEDSIPDAQ